MLQFYSSQELLVVGIYILAWCYKIVMYEYRCVGQPVTTVCSDVIMTYMHYRFQKYILIDHPS